MVFEMGRFSAELTERLSPLEVVVLVSEYGLCRVGIECVSSTAVVCVFRALRFPCAKPKGLARGGFDFVELRDDAKLLHEP